MTSVPAQSQNQTPSSVTSTTSSSSVFKYDQSNTTAATISNSNNLVKSDLTSNLDSKTTTAAIAATIDTNASSGSSNVFSASMGPTQVSTSYSKFQTSTLNPSERINPFDKNKQASAPAPVSASGAVETTASKPLESSVASSSYSSSASGSTLDDLTKNRFDKYQGVTSQSAGRYGTTTTSSDLYSSDSVKSTTSVLGGSSSTSTTSSSYITGSDLTKTEYSVTSSDYSKKQPVTTTSKTVSSSQRANAAKHAFETSKYSTGSMSDSEIIFGSNDLPDSLSRRTQFGSNISNTVDVSNSIFESGRNISSFNRSLSVSSENNGDFANDPRVNTSYRIYEGINNAAFQDYDSPVKTNTSSASETATSFSSTYVSGSKFLNDDDDYDLK